jgi:hypothetical protein
MKFDRNIDQGSTLVSQESGSLRMSGTDTSRATEQSSDFAVLAIGLGTVLTIIWCGSLAAGLFWLIF